MVFLHALIAVTFSFVAASCVRPANPSLKAEAPSPVVAPLTLTVEKAACTTPALRKEVRSLSSEEWGRFVAAVKKLMDRPSANGVTGPSVYDQLVKLQMDQYENVQGYALQLPFHRWLLKVFETELRKVDATVSLPYWDWVADAGAPQSSPVLSDAFMGGNGVGEGQCVTNGAFSGFTTFYPEQGSCLRRSFNRGAAITPFPSAKHMNKMFATVKSYDTFRQFITYVPAGAVRRGLGGDLASKAMANDPIFWLYMAYVDKTWADWQAKSAKNARAVNGLLKSHEVARATTLIPPSPHTIGDVLAIKDLCYAYQASPASKSAAGR